jgi:hypothetical protein
VGLPQLAALRAPAMLMKQRAALRLRSGHSDQSLAQRPDLSAWRWLAHLLARRLVG